VGSIVTIGELVTEETPSSSFYDGDGFVTAPSSPPDCDIRIMTATIKTISSKTPMINFALEFPESLARLPRLLRRAPQ
jgi:hypothetical protein